MLISNNDIIHYKITDNITNEKTFLLFMKECKRKIDEKNEGHYLIIMDNLSCHKTYKLIKYYFDNKINIVFNTPYASYFNSIELSFKYIKTKLYSKLYKNIDEVSLEVEKILNEKEFKENILKNYKKILEEYKTFYLDNEEIKFDNLIIE